jgi:putative ABC transport system permease protein
MRFRRVFRSITLPGTSDFGVKILISMMFASFIERFRLGLLVARSVDVRYVRAVKPIARSWMNAPFSYGLQLSFHNLKRTPWLTLSIVITLALGISTSMTALGLLHVLAADPIPSKSSTLYQPRRVYTDPTHSQMGFVSFADANELVGYLAEEGRGTMFSEGFGSAASPNGRTEKANAFVLHATRNFFPIFEVPFREGGAWSKTDDLEGNHVAVISAELARELFGRLPSAIGQNVRYGGAMFRVVGVLEEWRQTPRVYNLVTGGAYMRADDMYVPIKSVRDLSADAFLPFECDGDAKLPTNDKLFSSQCEWVSMWVELTTTSQYDQFRRHMHDLENGSFHYSISNVPAIIRDSGIVPVDVKIYSMLGIGFLILCVLGSSGALLGKFFRQGFETGLRRALGASQRDIQFEFLTESLLIGLLGGVLGLALTWIGLASVRQLQTPYAEVAHLDATMLLVTILIALASGVLAGCLPAWRAARVAPGLQIKAQ